MANFSTYKPTLGGFDYPTKWNMAMDELDTRFNTAASFLGTLAVAGAVALGSTLAVTGVLNSSAGIVLSGTTAIKRDVTNSFMQFTGGTTINVGATLSLFGSTHATRPSWIDFDAAKHEFRTAAGGTGTVVSVLGDVTLTGNLLPTGTTSGSAVAAWVGGTASGVYLNAPTGQTVRIGINNADKLTVDAGGINGAIGATTPSSAVFNALSVTSATAGAFTGRIRNTSAGTTAYTQWSIGADNDPDRFYIKALSSTFTTVSMDFQSGATVNGEGPGGLSVGATGGDLRFYAGGATLVGKFNANGHELFGDPGRLIITDTSDTTNRSYVTGWSSGAGTLMEMSVNRQINAVGSFVDDSTSYARFTERFDTRPAGPLVQWMYTPAATASSVTNTILLSMNNIGTLLLGPATTLSSGRQELLLAGNSGGSLIGLGLSGTNKARIECDSGGGLNISTTSAANITFAANNTQVATITPTSLALSRASDGDVFSAVRSGGFSTFIYTGTTLSGIFSASTASGFGFYWSAVGSHVYNAGTDIALHTSAGYFKASNNGVYANTGDSQHEFDNNVTGNGVLMLYHRHATNPFGLFLSYTASNPNNTGNQFIVCQNNTPTTLFEVRSNGGVGNISANNVNLSTRAVKYAIQRYDEAQLRAYERMLEDVDFGVWKYHGQTHDDWNHGPTVEGVRSALSKHGLHTEANSLIGDFGHGLEGLYTEDFKNIALASLVASNKRLRLELEEHKDWRTRAETALADKGITIH